MLTACCITPPTIPEPVLSWAFLRLVLWFTEWSQLRWIWSTHHILFTPFSPGSVWVPSRRINELVRDTSLRAVVVSESLCSLAWVSSNMNGLSCSHSLFPCLNCLCIWWLGMESTGWDSAISNGIWGACWWLLIWYGQVKRILTIVTWRALYTLHAVWEFCCWPGNRPQTHILWLYFLSLYLTKDTARYGGDNVHGVDQTWGC